MNNDLQESIQNLKIYKSSAGSGKTYTLVLEYLSILFSQKGNFRNILAITFTNKAASEMKSRILRALDSLSEALDPELAKLISAKTKIPVKDIPWIARESRSRILHNYSYFSVSTIDSFVQQIVKAFANEMGISTSFEIETDKKALLERITNDFLSRVGVEPNITHFVSEFLLEKLKDSRSWSMDDDFAKLAQVIESGKDLEKVTNLSHVEKDSFKAIIKSLKIKISRCIKKSNELGKKALDIYINSGIPKDQFRASRTDPYAFFEKLFNAEKIEQLIKFFELKVSQNLLSQQDLCKKKSPFKEQIEEMYFSGPLQTVLTELIQINSTFLPEAITSQEILKNLYGLAVLSELESLNKDYKIEHNVLTFNDFNIKISQFLQDESPEYLYWRLGTRYHHFLLDEFQDTSILQWDNFTPLFEDLISDFSKSSSLILVGDPKQAIYRFRGGEVFLMETLAPKFMGVTPLKLDYNYRSKKHIVEFNNQFFEEIISNTEEDSPLRDIFKGHTQKIKNDEEKGFVSYIPTDPEPKESEFPPWFHQTLDIIKEQKNDGFSYKDTAILLRKNPTAVLLSEFLNLNEIPIISSESLLIKNSPKIKFLIGLLGSILSPKDHFSYSQAYIHYLIISNKEKELANPDHFPTKENLTPQNLDYYKSNYIKLSSQLTSSTLYDFFESAIDHFSLGDLPTAILQHFLDVVLDFERKKGSNPSEFLKHWEENKSTFSITIPENLDGVKILTLHKSKGLEFPSVIIPLDGWDVVPHHGNTYIWGESPEEHKEEISHFYLKYSKNLEKTAFNNVYQKEKNDTLIDNINLLYVGFTRPKDRLFILECGNPTKQIRTLVRPIIDKIFTWKEDLQRFEFGGKSKYLISEESQKDRIGTTFYASSSFKRVSVKTRHEDLWGMQGETNKNGENSFFPILPLVREALIRATNQDHLDFVLNEMQREGLINALQKQKIEVLCGSWLHSSLGSWYIDSEAQIKKSKKIVLSNGDLFTIDREKFENGKNEYLVYILNKDDNRLEELKNGLSFSQENEENRYSNYFIFNLHLGKLEGLTL